jgi:ubiquinone/menaquinone biosynthesis C-methylase UbiE
MGSTPVAKRSNGFGCRWALASSTYVVEAERRRFPRPESKFHAVVCVFGIFFVPDMPAAVRELWRVVRPGGRLAITTWGPNFFEPATTAFWNAVREVRPDLYKGFNPWDRISDPPSSTE